MKTRSKKQSPGKAYLGLDLHSATTVMAVMNEPGEIVATSRFATTGHNLVSAVSSVRAAEKHVAIEEAPMTHWAIELLRPVCGRVISCDAKQNRWISGNPQKNDETDAERLAELLRLGRLKEVYHTRDADRFAFKGSVQHYLDVQRDRVRAKNKIKALLKRLGLNSPGGERPFAQKHRDAVLELVPPGGWRRCLQRRYRHYDWLDAESREALAEVRELGRPYPEIAEFMKVPGVGPVTAHCISAFVQTPHRFASKGALFRYAGLSVTDRSSDGRRLGYQRLERGTGNPEIKRATYHAWLGAVATPKANEVKGWFEACLAANGRQQKRARLATQRKILQTLWSMWLHKTTYDPGRFTYRPRPVEP